MDCRLYRALPLCSQRFDHLEIIFDATSAFPQWWVAVAACGQTSPTGLKKIRRAPMSFCGGRHDFGLTGSAPIRHGCYPPRRLTCRMVEAARDARLFHPTDPAFEPSLHQHQSPPWGNAILRDRDKGPERAWKSNRQIAETNRCTNAPRLGAIRTELGNLCLPKTAWWAREACPHRVISTL